MKCFDLKLNRNAEYINEKFLAQRHARGKHSVQRCSSLSRFGTIFVNRACCQDAIVELYSHLKQVVQQFHDNFPRKRIKLLSL